MKNSVGIELNRHFVVRIHSNVTLYFNLYPNISACSINLTMDSHCSKSTINMTTTSSSLICSGSSSKSLVRINSRSTMVRNKGIKVASRNNTKHRSKGVGISRRSRWRAAVRRDSSLTTLHKMGLRKPSRNAVVKSTLSLASNLGRGFEGLRLASLGNIRNAIFKNGPVPIKENSCVNSSNNNDSSPTYIIKSAALQQALHREIECQPLIPGQDRWSEQSRDDKMLTPGQDRGSKKSSSDTRRDSVLCKPPTRRGSVD
mmetsp:Transcript_16868/g.16894  ORF Transcript_16868/g.16894 Transcript_16868/m.16894 type:complete len:258 (+) Transcript_16868:137-910(+)